MTVLVAPESGVARKCASSGVPGASHKPRGGVDRLLGLPITAAALAVFAFAALSSLSPSYPNIGNVGVESLFSTCFADGVC